MKIEVDDEFMDEITGASLVDTYVRISKDVKKTDVWHEDDIATLKELLPALKIVGNWYCYDFEGKVKKAKRK